MNAISDEKLPTSMAFYIRPTGTQIFRGFMVHNLITCKSKVQVVSLGLYLFKSPQKTYLQIVKQLNFHIQVKTNDRKVRRFGNILAPLSRETKLKLRLRE